MKVFVFSIMICMVMVCSFEKECSAGAVFGKVASNSSETQSSPALKVKNETDVRFKITTTLRGIGIERFIAPGGEYVHDITNSTILYMIESEDGKDLLHRGTAEVGCGNLFLSIKKNIDGEFVVEMDKKSSQGSLRIAS